MRFGIIGDMPRDSDQPALEPPIGIVSVSGEEVVSTPGELSAQCAFPVFLPTHWPHECGDRVLALSRTMFGTDYLVRSERDAAKPMLMIMGSQWRAGTIYPEDGFRPVDGMPWPTLIRRIRPAVAIVVKAPETRIFLFSTLHRDAAIAVARSLRPAENS